MTKFALPTLSFAEDALAPTMSAETLAYHYGKHHASYVANLDKLVENSIWEGKPLEAILCGADGALFNNAAQHFNHTFFWQCMTPNGGGRPEGELLWALEQEWGSFEAFVEAFSKAAASNFGSGWTWLIKRADGTLAIENTSNADTPVAHGKKPLLVIDIWEHAYYIDYRNNRVAFIDGFLKRLVNWNFVAAQFVA